MNAWIPLAVWLHLLLPQGSYEGRYELTALPSGVRLVVVEEPWNPTIAIGVVVAAGVGEEVQHAGIGTVVAHAMLRGTANLPADSVARDVARSGGSVEVSRQPDYLAFSSVTTRAAFADATYALCQALIHASLDAEAVDWGRRHALRIIQLEENSALAAATRAFRNAAYRSVAYGGPFSGTRESLGRITPDAARQWYRSQVTADRTTIAVCGNIEASIVRQILSRQLAEFGRQSRPKQAAEWEPERLREDLSLRRQLPIGTAMLASGFLGPGVTHPDQPAFTVLAAILGGGKASRLFQAFRDTTGVGYELGVECPPLLQGSHLVAYLEIDSARLDDRGRGSQTAALQRRLSDLVLDAATTAPSDAEMARAKQYLKGTLMRRTERSRDRALQAAWQVGVVDMEPSLDTYLQKIEKVTSEEVLRVARRYLDLRVDVLVLPEPVRATKAAASP